MSHTVYGDKINLGLVDGNSEDDDSNPTVIKTEIFKLVSHKYFLLISSSTRYLDHTMSA